MIRKIIMLTAAASLCFSVTSKAISAERTEAKDQPQIKSSVEISKADSSVVSSDGNKQDKDSETTTLIIVMLVILIIWIGVSVYIFNLDRRLKDVEDRLKE